MIYYFSVYERIKLRELLSIQVNTTKKEHCKHKMVLDFDTKNSSESLYCFNSVITFIALKKN